MGIIHLKSTFQMWCLRHTLGILSMPTDIYFKENHPINLGGNLGKRAWKGKRSPGSSLAFVMLYK